MKQTKIPYCSLSVTKIIIKKKGLVKGLGQFELYCNWILFFASKETGLEVNADIQLSTWLCLEIRMQDEVKT